MLTIVAAVLLAFLLPPPARSCFQSCLFVCSLLRYRKNCLTDLMKCGEQNGQEHRKNALVLGIDSAPMWQFIVVHLIPWIS